MSPFVTPTPRQVSTGLLVLRIVAGIIFVAHGGQKLFTFGLAGVTQGFAGMGIPLPMITGPAVAFVELLGGTALIIGLLTRLAGVGLAITMAGAIVFAHLSSGFFAPKGYEFPLALLGIAAALAFTGAGPYSADAALARHRK